MRVAVRFSKLALAVLLIGAVSATASDEKGEAGDQNAGGKTSNVSGVDHDVPGVVTTTASGYFLGSPHGAWIDATAFPLAGGGGPSPAKWGPAPYVAVAVTQRPVKILNQEYKLIIVQPGDPNSNPPSPPMYGYILAKGASTGHEFQANCHEAQKLSAPIKVPAGAPAETGSSGSTGQDPGVKVDPDLPEFEFRVWVCYTGPGHLFRYTVTNNLIVPIEFSWPAVRTPEHPNGWSATVESDSSLVYEFDGSGDAVLVYGAPGDVTVACADETTAVIGQHVVDAWCPAESVNISSPVTQLQAFDAATTVTLTWLNPQVYDTIQVFRYVNDHIPQAWALQGTEDAFVDMDAPLGEVRYEVIGVRQGVGPATAPSATVLRE
jgi:hypothetical protein